MSDKGGEQEKRPGFRFQDFEVCRVRVCGYECSVIIKEWLTFELKGLLM